MPDPQWIIAQWLREHTATISRDARTPQPRDEETSWWEDEFGEPLPDELKDEQPVNWWVELTPLILGLIALAVFLLVVS